MKNSSQNKGGLSPRKAKNFWGTLRRLMTYMANRIWGVLLVLVLTIAATIFTTLTPKMLGRATTEIFRGYQEGMALRESGQTVDVLPINFDLIGEILVMVFILYISAGLTSVA
ncbi:hypothetical protein LMF32_01765 [Desemzia sp. C1]|uniref:hypothetical protein n=1 Tax=Desemzia sp. C1 TaxID=2892016 RepID=UPI001E5BB59B|nr:hypothetical protein [Desemzia sp. C1]MCI3027862.1 hypothetical protein [Desemzia sp. C1]